MNPRRIRSQRGSVVIEVTWLSILLLVPLLYVVLAVFEVQSAAFGAQAAARAAGRAYATAPTEAAGRERARAAAGIALRDQRADPEQMTLRLECRPDPGDCLAPGAVVEVDLSYPVRLPLMPPVLGDQAPSVLVTAHHRVPYGTFRENR